MKKPICMVMLAFVLVVGMSHSAFARHVHHGHGVKHGFYKIKKHKHHRVYRRFHRHVWYHHQPLVVVKERHVYCPGPVPYRGTSGTELDFGSIILRLPEVVIFK